MTAPEVIFGNEYSRSSSIEFFQFRDYVLAFFLRLICTKRRVQGEQAETVRGQFSGCTRDDAGTVFRDCNIVHLFRCASCLARGCVSGIEKVTTNINTETLTTTTGERRFRRVSILAPPWPRTRSSFTTRDSTLFQESSTRFALRFSVAGTNRNRCNRISYKSYLDHAGYHHIVRTCGLRSRIARVFLSSEPFWSNTIMHHVYRFFLLCFLLQPSSFTLHVL